MAGAGRERGRGSVGRAGVGRGWGGGSGRAAGIGGGTCRSRGTVWIVSEALRTFRSKERARREFVGGLEKEWGVLEKSGKLEEKN